MANDSFKVHNDLDAPNLGGGTSDHDLLTNKDAADQHPATSITESASKRFVTDAEKTDWNDKEDGLGNPGTDGQVLASTTSGTRSWVDPGEGGGGTGGIVDNTDKLHIDDAYGGSVTPAFSTKTYTLFKSPVAGFNQSTVQDVIFNWKSPGDADQSNLVFKYRIYLSPDDHLGSTTVNSVWLLKTLRAMGIDLDAASFSGDGTKIITNDSMLADAVYKSRWSDAFTVTNMEQGDLVFLNLIRDINDIADTYAGIINITHIEIAYKKGNQEVDPEIIPPTVVYVKGDATGANDGTSWADAYNTPQGLMTAITNSTADDEIWVAVGATQYKAFSASSSPHLISNPMSIYGGFVGTETTRIERNPSTNVTWIVGGAGSNPANSWNVFAIDADNVTIDGFTIAYGYADGTGNAAVGGNINAYAGKTGITIENCIITSGVSTYQGGGIYVNAGAQVTVKNSSITNNTAENGAAIALDSGAIFVMEDCLIQYNGGLSASSYGPAMYSAGGISTIRRCIFDENSVNPYDAHTRAIYLTNPQQAHFLNCLFTANYSKAGFSYATLWITGTGGTDTIFTNCTFRKNNSTNYSVFYIAPNVQADFFNCNFWENIGANPLYNESSNVSLIHCNYQSLIAGSATLSDNTEVDPLFVGALDSRLQNGSPCKDTGDNTYIAGESTDLDGLPRIVNTTVDKGCYENQT